MHSFTETDIFFTPFISLMRKHISCKWLHLYLFVYFSKALEWKKKLIYYRYPQHTVGSISIFFLLFLLYLIESVRHKVQFFHFEHSTECSVFYYLIVPICIAYSNHIQRTNAKYGGLKNVYGNKSCNVYKVIVFNWFCERFTWKTHSCVRAHVDFSSSFCPKYGKNTNWNV